VASDLLRQLGSREITKAKLFEMVESDFSLLPILLDGTLSSKATVRYGCGNVLVELSENYPNKLYSYMNNFITLLDSKYRILTWNAMAVIANLTATDTDRKFEAIFDKYFSYLGSEYMVTVTNVVANSAIIVSNKPYLADRIASELLRVQDLKMTPHLTDECKLVIAEHAIRTFGTLIRYTQNKAALIVFVEKHQNSKRASLKKEAQNFLKKWQKA
jgi:hypothetical protein